MSIIFLVWRNLHSISSITKHSSHLHINLSDNRGIIVYNNSEKMVAMGVEEQGSFWLIEVENAGLVQQKDGYNVTENATIMLRQERCQGRHTSNNEALDDVATETNQNQQRRESKQQVYYALSDVTHKKKTLKEGEDEVVKKTRKEGEDDVASKEKQTQNLDMLNCQDVE
jgi:hypothetical protein